VPLNEPRISRMTAVPRSPDRKNIWASLTQRPIGQTRSSLIAISSGRMNSMMCRRFSRINARPSYLYRIGIDFLHQGYSTRFGAEMLPDAPQGRLDDGHHIRICQIRMNSSSFNSPFSNNVIASPYMSPERQHAPANQNWFPTTGFNTTGTLSPNRTHTISPWSCRIAYGPLPK